MKVKTTFSLALILFFLQIFNMQMLVAICTKWNSDKSIWHLNRNFNYNSFLLTFKDKVRRRNRKMISNYFRYVFIFLPGTKEKLLEMSCKRLQYLSKNKSPINPISTFKTDVAKFSLNFVIVYINYYMWIY